MHNISVCSKDGSRDSDGSRRNFNLKVGNNTVNYIVGVFKLVAARVAAAAAAVAVAANTKMIVRPRTVDQKNYISLGRQTLCGCCRRCAS